MFWRFHLANGSSIDSLLNKDDVSLEAILDEDDLLQECKAQNTRLIDYFQRVDVLLRLMGYVTGQIEGEEKGRFKYPHVATEVLCSEIWSIVETCVNHSNQLLVPFWETVLDRSPEEMKTQMVLASHFAKINSVFLGKKPSEMLAFIQAQPSIIERLLRHIETPAFADLLMRIVQLDELPAGEGVLEWLSQENLMSRLIERLSSNYPSDMHAVVSEVIKSIITMAAPSPGSGLSEGLNNGPASNRFARELAHPKSLAKLTDYILMQFSPDECERGDEIDKAESSALPNHESSSSAVVHSIGIIIELIRQNNSDYFEPYLFHTLRTRLIQVQQQLHTYSEDGREVLERAMQEMVNRMGVVHLGPLLELMADRLAQFQRYLKNPRSLKGPVSTTIGAITPLTFERYRICELYAELLHGSNMALLNRSPEYDHLYDLQGRLQGGLSALEELAKVISIASANNRDQEPMDDQDDEIELAKELPIHDPSLSLDSDEDMIADDEPGSSDDETMEEIAMYDDNKASPSPLLSLHLSSSPVALISSSPVSGSPRSLRRKSSDSLSSTARSRPRSSRQSSRKGTITETPKDFVPVGERLKQRFLELDVLSTLLDLFFEFPWNNFLHSVVYDIIHQILTGRQEGGYNRELIVSLFRDARVLHRIIEGQKKNDFESAKPKGLRLGYMGHLTLISEDVITAMEHSPVDLRLIMKQYTPQPEWDEYVTGRYQETKTKDTSLLGGGKPAVSLASRPGNGWKVDEQDMAGTSAIMPAVGKARAIASRVEESRGEFRRSAAARREGSADFGSAIPMDEEEDGPLANHGDSANIGEHPQAFHFPDDFASSSDEEDSDEEDAGWLASSTFGTGQGSPRQRSSEPPLRNGIGDIPDSHRRTTGRRPLSEGFEDAFDPVRAFGTTIDDPFAGDEDDGFGPFSDAAASGTDPFTFSSSFSDELDESTFDTFGDFGEFQNGSGSGNDGDLTPTTGDSWTFASASSSSTSTNDDLSEGDLRTGNLSNSGL